MVVELELKELKELLEITGYPVAYSHFNEPVEPPYIVYLVDNNLNFIADNKTYHKITDVDIELYTRYKDESVEMVLENILDQHEIPYRPYDVYIDDQKMFMRTYEIRIF